MPFIWDDFEWKMVDDQKPYDKNRFVVVRKLRVKLNTASHCTLPNDDFSIDSIRKHSEHFGEIESIKIISGKENEAYVTFVSDQSAYSMQSEYVENNKMQPFHVQPADTWEQPRENMNPSPQEDMEQTSEIFMLNEDCFRHVFMFLDFDSLVELADVCKLFNRLLHQHCFRRIRNFKVTNKYNKNQRYALRFSMSLAKMRRILQCIGTYITDLHFECDVELEWQWNLKHDIVTRFLEVLVENVGTNIRRAWISCKTICKNDRIFILAPIFRHLDVLKLTARTYDNRYDIDFYALCPNLVDIEVDVNVQMRGCIKPWKSLRRLAIINSNMNTMDLFNLIKLNPQLTHVEVMDQQNVNIILAISELRTLEKVKIASLRCFFNSQTLNEFKIDCLSKLQHLTEISLIRLHPESLIRILDCLATFVGLRKIHLHKDDIYDEPMPDYSKSLNQLAVEQPFLEEIELMEVKITETILMDFIRFAGQLKKLKLGNCGLKFTNELILNMVDVLKCNRSESNHILELKLYSFEVKKLNVIESESVLRYLQVKSI